MPNLFNNNKFLVSLVFILALMPRMAAGIISGHSLSGDEIAFTNLATCILEGKTYGDNIPPGFSNARLPLYPLFIAVIYFFTNGSILAVKLAQALVGAFTSLIIFFIAEDIFKNRLVSFVAAIIFAIYPLAISLGESLFSESFFTFLLALAIFFILKGSDRPNLKNLSLSGIFLGLAALTRPAIWAFLPFFILWSLLFSSGNFLSSTKNSIFIILLMALTVSPWAIRNYVVFKKLTPLPTGGSITFYVYNNEYTLKKIFDPLIFLSETPLTDEQKRDLSLLSEPERDKYLYRLGWEFARSHPKDFLKIRLISIGQFWSLWPESPSRYKEYYSKKGAYRSPILDEFADTSILYSVKIIYHLLYDALFVGMFISLYFSFKMGVGFRKSFLLISLLIAMTLLFSIHGTVRYRLPVDPYVFLLGTHGILSLRRKK